MEITELSLINSVTAEKAASNLVPAVPSGMLTDLGSPVAAFSDYGIYVCSTGLLCYSFEFEVGSWQKMPDLPGGSAQKDRYSMIVSNNQLMFGAGVSLSSGPDFAEGTYKYCLMEFEGKIHVLGGFSNNILKAKAEVHRLEDAAASTWTALASMNQMRYTHACAVIHWPETESDRIITAGGKLSSTVHLDSLEVYDPIGNSWQTLSTKLPGKMGDIKLGFASGPYFYLPGPNYSGGHEPEVFVYDAKTDQVQLVQGEPLATSSYAFGAIIRNQA